MRSRSLLWLRRIALICGALLVALFLFGLYCSHTESGRKFAARRIERFVTANIPGRLSIGKITHLGWGHVEAQEVRFWHPDGRCVLRVGEAEVDIELAEVLHGRLSFERAVAHGGFVLRSRGRRAA
jgi:autotransporter translocation and assembly factor TamB